MRWSVYLSGEIHTNWREQIAQGVALAELPVDLFGPVTDHDASDACGQIILAEGRETNPFWVDHMGAQMNAIRTRTLLEKADIVVVRFGDKYKQWNAAFDAGYAAALGKKIITLHSDEHIHMLKEVDSAALAVCESVEQVVRVLKYVITGALD